MKNTLIPLDMIFIDPAGTVTHIHENAVPLDLTGIDGGTGVQAVLEINGGLSRALGITVGSEIRHPSFDEAGAVWPVPRNRCVTAQTRGFSLRPSATIETAVGA